MCMTRKMDEPMVQVGTRIKESQKKFLKEKRMNASALLRQAIEAVKEDKLIYVHE